VPPEELLPEELAPDEPLLEEDELLLEVTPDEELLEEELPEELEEELLLDELLEELLLEELELEADALGVLSPLPPHADNRAPNVTITNQAPAVER